MACQPPRSDQRSIKYRFNPREGAYFELPDFAHEGRSPNISETNEQSHKTSDSKSSEIMSTSEFISAVGQVWDYASRPLSVSQTKGHLKSDSSDCQKEDIFGIIIGGESVGESTPAGSRQISVESRIDGNFLPTLQPKFELLTVTQKISAFEPWTKETSHTFHVGLLHKFCVMSGIIPSRLNHPASFTQADDKNTEKCSSQGGMVPVSAESCTGVDIDSPSIKMTKESADYYPELIIYNEPSSHITESNVSSSKSTASLCSGYHDNSLNFYKDASEEYRTIDDQLLENKSEQIEKCAIEYEGAKTKVCSTAHDKSHHAVAKQEHAFAGALAGICVSLSLHPVDTIKTVIQSCHADQKSVFDIGRSIVSERGLTGLYRGIASNIASSAPISAVYTFTYESVKGALLPLFPKEYYSLAHCTAGGCASIATSFIFTPSERIKQQMQVGSHYQNCWNALVGVLRKGGLPSLYAGWGAVLCRNIPHSIIKFYAYENLKQMMLPSLPFHSQPGTLQTLFCGGIAGSTAALFTTPFDVVKTRLQTQIPGALSQYNSVFHAIRQISKYEGLRGLYRGLTPRLVMYMSQGALFFTSYEFFKRVFALEASQLKAPKIDHQSS